MGGLCSPSEVGGWSASAMNEASISLHFVYFTATMSEGETLFVNISIMIHTFSDSDNDALFILQSYIVQSMWIGIVTLTFLIIYRYIYKFYRLLKANEQFRITALARNAAAMSRGGMAGEESIYDIVYRLKKKVKVLLAMTVITMFSWYPLFALTLLDVHFMRARYLYRILTVIAWSHSALTPLPLLLADKSFGLSHQVKRLLLKYKTKADPSQSPKHSLLPTNQQADLPKQQVHQRNHFVNNANNANSEAKLKASLAPSIDISVPTTGTNLVQRSKQGLVTNNGMFKPPQQLRRTEEMYYDVSLPTVTGPNSEGVRSINQSRETDLLNDCSSLLDYDLV